MSELTSQPSSEPLFSKELVPILSWYKEACAKLPEMRVSITPLKDSKESNVNPSFFSYANVDVTSSRQSWQQGGLLQEGNGVTVLLTDPDGKTFVTVSQEPMAKAQRRGMTEIHPVVRSPLQTSEEKLKRASDTTMRTILETVARDRNVLVQKLLGSIPLSHATTDGNRMQSDVLYGALTVSRELAKNIEKGVPAGRWVTQKELDALTVMGVTNGNLNIARTVTESQQRLTKR